MAEFTRRHFIRTGIAGAIVAGDTLSALGVASNIPAKVDLVDLGKTGLKVTRLAMGMGTNGFVALHDQSQLDRR
ncbi:MAG: hypothetical protein M0Q53_07560 [Prolixibacteraceae bacterium]|jgi:hypothetical protein|nr:hypothetical protein [Prolixibacteraceae bacterium]